MKRQLTELDRLNGWSLTWRICIAALAGAATATQFTRALDITCPPKGLAFLGFAMVGVISWLMPGVIAFVIQRHGEELRRP